VTQPTRFAFYGRVSTVDKQDPTLSFPSQERACQAKARELGGEIVCEFTDQASGTTADRPGWSALVVEARQAGRRFDGVICFSTSRLARDLVMAGLFERELRHAGVGIYYVQGAADTSTAEGGLLVTLQQAFDQYEVEKIRRETRRGMTEGTRQGYRMGGRAPYGYRTVREPTPESHRGETKSA
jgi:DNA invertase Pin-like site-specific DNA recombinase